MLPFRLGDFVAPRAGEHQQEDGISGGAVFVDGDRVDEALRLFPGKKPVALRLLAELTAAGWVSRHAGHLPFGGEIVHVAQDHHDAVRGADRIAVRPHARDQRDDMLGRDLIERHFPERGQDMDASTVSSVPQLRL